MAWTLVIAPYSAASAQWTHAHDLNKLSNPVCDYFRIFKHQWTVSFDWLFPEAARWFSDQGVAAWVCKNVVLLSGPLEKALCNDTPHADVFLATLLLITSLKFHFHYLVGSPYHQLLSFSQWTQIEGAGAPCRDSVLDLKGHFSSKGGKMFQFNVISLGKSQQHYLNALKVDTL